MYCPSSTVNFCAVSRNCVSARRSASATSAPAIKSMPIGLSSGAAAVVTSVPSTMKLTAARTSFRGDSSRSATIVASTTTGVKALSICTKLTPRCKYTALPQARVAACSMPTGSTRRYQLAPATNSRFSWRTVATPVATRMRATNAEQVTPRAESSIGKGNPSSRIIVLLVTMSAGPTVMYSMHRNAALSPPITAGIVGCAMVRVRG
mmetsp:Transcript_43591/g.136777  ORF Transcript_43591/g.136777 Transcript_43591/m.136777 type:complete len:207 (+) Transcript_43591:463-1083(+)